MIKNERQYKITKAQAARFSGALEHLRQRSNSDTGVHPLIAKAQEYAMASQLSDLESELREYESLKAGEFQWDSLRLVADLPSILIKARIAQGLSQKDLAVRVGLKEQQIQKYEATDYAGANLSRIQEVVSAFGLDFDGPVSSTVSR